MILSRLGIYARYLAVTTFLSASFALPSTAQSNRSVLLVLSKAEGQLAVLDPETMKVRARVATGADPHEVVISSDGKTAFVSNYGGQTPGNSISVIDIATAKELRRVDVSPLMRPHGLHFLGNKLYFTSETNRLIARYDPTANKVDWVMGTGQNGSHMVVGTADQKHFYTSDIGSDSITAFDFGNVPPAGSKITHVAVGKQPEAIDLSPDGKEVWAGLNVDSAVDIVDTATYKVKERVNTKGRPYRVRFTPDGKLVLCTLIPTKELLILDAVTRKEVGRVKLDGVPLGIVVSTDSTTAFVTAAEPDGVYKIDLRKMTVISTAEAGKGLDGIALFGI
jgi:YVTN family beta-propeller protein